MSTSVKIDLEHRRAVISKCQDRPVCKLGYTVQFQLKIEQVSTRYYGNLRDTSKIYAYPFELAAVLRKLDQGIICNVSAIGDI